MAISKVGTNSSGDSASTSNPLTVSKPTGITPDGTHILILVIATGAGGNPDAYSTAPTGWTLVGSLLNQLNSADHISGWVYWSLGSNTNLGFTRTANVGGTVGWEMVAFLGCDTTTPIDATGTANSSTANNATLTTNLVTIATANAWHCIGFLDWLGGTFSATGFTNAENAAANESAALLYNTTPKSTGSTGTVVVTSSAGTSGQVLIGIPFALRPAAGGAAGIPNKLLSINQAVRRAAFY